MEKDISPNGNQKKARRAILISDKIDFKIKTVTREEGYKEGYYVMVKESIQEKYIAIVNIYPPNIRATQYIRQI